MVKYFGMNLYYYGIDNVTGGLESYAKTLISNLVKLDSSINITIISCYPDYAYRDYLESIGVKSIIAPNYKKHPIRYKKSIYNTLKIHNKDDIIQLNVMSYRNLALFSSVKKAKINTLVVGHGSNLVGGFTTKLLHRIGRRSYSKLGKKVAISKDVIPYMFKNDKDVTVIPNSVDTSLYKYNDAYRNEIRDKYNLSDAFVIGHVGRIHNVKNQEFSISLINELVKHIPNARLLVVGKNQDDKIYELIKNNPYIIHVEEVDDIYKYYSAFDIEILPSKYEGFGLALYEGLANGLEVFISDKVPYPEYISNNVYQLPLDIDTWVKEILNHQGSRRKESTSGIEKYDSISMAKSYWDVYLA